MSIVEYLSIRIECASVIKRSRTVRILELIFLVRIKTGKGNPPYTFLIITVHCIIRISLPVAEITQEVAISLAFSIVITVIENEGNAAVSIVIDTVVHSFRKRSFDTITIVCDCDEIICGLNVCRLVSGNDSNGLKRRIARAEPLADGRRQCQRPKISTDICELISHIIVTPLGSAVRYIDTIDVLKPDMSIKVFGIAIEII